MSPLIPQIDVSAGLDLSRLINLKTFRINVCHFTWKGEYTEIETAAHILSLLDAPLLQTFSLVTLYDRSVSQWKGFSDLDDCLATARFANIRFIVELLAYEEKPDPLTERSEKIEERFPQAKGRGVLEVRDLDDPIFLPSSDWE